MILARNPFKLPDHKLIIDTSILLVANSTPIVCLDPSVNSFLANRERRLLLPTPESPVRTILNK